MKLTMKCTGVDKIAAELGPDGNPIPGTHRPVDRYRCEFAGEGASLRLDTTSPEYQAGNVYEITIAPGD